MVGHCIGQGLRSARRSPGLVALLWCWTLALAALAAFPAWLWLGSGFNLAPESDRMLSGFNFEVFSELAQYDRSPVQGILLASIMAVILLAALANPLVSGGLIEALTVQDGTTALQRFFRGAGRFFWRYLRLMVYGAITAAVLIGILSLVFQRMTKSLQDSPWEPASIVGSAVQMVVLAAIGAFVILALDFARIRTAAEDSRRTLRIWFSSIGFVLRHLPATCAILVAPVAIFAAVAAVYLGAYRYVPPRTWLLILVMIVLQQVVMYLRAGLRVALVASEIDYFHARFSPAAAKPMQTAPPPAVSLGGDTHEAATPTPETPEEKTEDIPPGSCSCH